MSSKDFLEGLRNEFPGAVTKIEGNSRYFSAEFSSDAAASIFSVCKGERGRFDLLEDLFAYDSADNIGLVYNLYSTVLNYRILLKSPLDRRNPLIISATEYWLSAIHYEREIAELFGVRFRNVETDIPFLLAKAWNGYPMRKDYTFPAGFNGIVHGMERRSQ